MVPKIAGQYIVKRISDQIMAPPPSAAEPEADDRETRPANPPVVDELDGQAVVDEEGNAVGTARRLASVAVYVVAERRGEAEAELLRSINDPDGRLLVRSEDGHIVALIYVPDPSGAPVRVEGIRSDDI